LRNFIRLAARSKRNFDAKLPIQFQKTNSFYPEVIDMYATA